MRHLEGTPDEHGLLQTIRPSQLQFRRAIRVTAPEFRPYERRYASSWSTPSATFMVNEEEEVDADQGKYVGEDNIIFIDEVFRRAQKCVLQTLRHSLTT